MTTSLDMAQYRFERAEQMAAKYRAGATLQEIGDYYGVTRERVRQIMSQELGITRKDGGMSKRASEKRKAAQARKNLRYMRKYGLDVAQYKRVQKNLDASGTNPLHRFTQQKRHSYRRGIEWNLIFAEWWSFWERSGKWDKRGRGNGYVMARHGDKGGYEIGNVKIISAKENQSEYIRRYWKEVKSGFRPRPGKSTYNNSQVSLK